MSAHGAKAQAPGRASFPHAPPGGLVRLLADENIPIASIQVLRAEGHDVLSASEVMRGTGDPELLARAGAEERVLVTFDRDFGTLAFGRGLSASAGIVLLRFVPATAEEPAAVLMDLLSDSRMTGCRTDPSARSSTTRRMPP
jgi:predicted nuclease of predicted toxin-antitoxin system